MKRVLLASTVILFATSADAADIPYVEPVPAVPVAAVYDWSGFYIGGHIGYGWSDFEYENPAVSISGLPLGGLPGLIIGVPLEREFDSDGFLGGATVGADAQFGSFVVGVLGDFSWTDISGEFRSTAVLGGGLTTAEGVSADLNWFGTGRGRLGWAFDRFMVYGTGGVAFGEVESAGDITLSAPIVGAAVLPVATLTASGEEIHVGWTAGVGVEGMLTEHFSAKLEYLYADLGEAHHEGPATFTSPVALIPAGISLEGQGDFAVDLHSIKLGLNYRF